MNAQLVYALDSFDDLADNLDSMAKLNLPSDHTAALRDYYEGKFTAYQLAAKWLREKVKMFRDGYCRTEGGLDLRGEAEESGVKLP